MLQFTAFRVEKEDGGWSIREPAFKKVNLVSFFGWINFALNIDAIIELLVLHPLALEGLFTIRSGDGLGDFHAFGLDEFNFGGDFFEIIFGMGRFFFLYYGR